MLSLLKVQEKSDELPNHKYIKLYEFKYTRSIWNTVPANMSIAEINWTKMKGLNASADSMKSLQSFEIRQMIFLKWKLWPPNEYNIFLTSWPKHGNESIDTKMHVYFDCFGSIRWVNVQTFRRKHDDVDTRQ